MFFLASPFQATNGATSTSASLHRRCRMEHLLFRTLLSSPCLHFVAKLMPSCSQVRLSIYFAWRRLLSDIYCLSVLIFICHISHFVLLKILLFMTYFTWGRAIIWMIIYDEEAFLKRKEKLYFSCIFLRRKIWSSEGVPSFCDVL